MIVAAEGVKVGNSQQQKVSSGAGSHETSRDQTMVDTERLDCSVLADSNAIMS